MSIIKRAEIGDLALVRAEGGYAFAVVRSIQKDGAVGSADRSSRASEPRTVFVNGPAVAVGSASECTFDVPAFVEATPEIFDTPQDAQRAARKWMADDAEATKRLDKALAKAEAPP